MPIIHFTFRPTEVPADAANVQGHIERGRKTHGFYNEQGRYVDSGEELYGPHVMWTWHTHVGLCLFDYERNGYNDSDFHMVVWDEATQSPKDICFASTRGWSYPSYGSSADATEEVKDKYDAYRIAEEAKIAAEKAEAEAREPKKGREVVVVRGSKNVAKGARGTVFWYGLDKYGLSRYGTWDRRKMRVGLLLADGTKVFCPASMVEVVKA
jgi:hypothetical protein